MQKSYLEAPQGGGEAADITEISLPCLRVKRRLPLPLPLPLSLRVLILKGVITRNSSGRRCQRDALRGAFVGAQNENVTAASVMLARKRIEVMISQTIVGKRLRENAPAGRGRLDKRLNERTVLPC